VGTDATTGDAVFLDLESAKMVELIGDEQSVRRFARSAVLDLAVSDRADDLCVIAINVGQGLDDLERVHPVDSYSSALTHAVRCGHATPDSTTPTVVVSAEVPVADGESTAALQDLGVVLVAPGLDSLVQIRIDGDHAKIMPEGTSVLLAALNDHDYRALAELVETTSSAAVEVVDETTILEEHLDVAVATACPIEAGPVEVKVLGPVVVSGAQSFSSLKAVDVVAYLAFHRHGVDSDQIKTWVWPAFAPPTDKAFANVMSRARTGLGTADDGSPFLSRAGADKTYRLAEAVTTDFDRFRAIVELADAATETASTLASLRHALELIRGVPFTGGAASSFSWADNHVRARVEYTIDETVHRCADLALEVGDLATARWAALKGLELVPGCEQCFKRRFLIAGAGNNRTELRRAMADLEASAMADLGEPEAVDTISGELLDLYHELDQALVAGSA
jgi:DNA-binding SARP family transcriptional activator